jgi:Tfp pilus assembly protein PilF
MNSLEDLKKCEVCGEINDYKSNVCIGCGAFLKKEVIRSGSETIGQGQSESGNSGGGKKPSFKEKVTKPVETQKILTKRSLFYLIFGLLLGAGVLLYSGGQFEEPKVTVGAGKDSRSGVDLENLNQINLLEEAVGKDPNDKNSVIRLAHLLNDSGFKEKAIGRYQDYLKFDPKNADVLVDLGVCYYETGKNKEAMSVMEKALTIQPEHQIANLNLGIVNMSGGFKDKAFAYWKKAIQIDSTNEIGRKAEELIKSH